MDLEHIRVRSMPRESPFSPLSYAKHPSTSILAASPLNRKRAVGEENPVLAATPTAASSSLPLKAKSNASTLNVHHGWEGDATPPTEPRRILRCYHNSQSTTEREYPKTGIRHVDPVEHTPRGKGVRVCFESRNHRQQACIVGVSDPVVSTPRTGVRCLRSNEGAQMSSLLSIEREPVSQTPTKRDFSLALEQKFVVTISDHAQRRHGGLSNFYVSLTRSMIANPTLNPEELRVQDPLLFQFVNKDRPVLTLGSCKEQLCALTSMPLTSIAFAQLFWNMEGCEEVDEETLDSLQIPFHDFARVFANTPQSLLSTKYKI